MNISTSVIEQGSYTENTYGSKLSLRVHRDSFALTVIGTYSPPPSPGSNGTGTAMLTGRIEENGSLIRGEWTHVDGPLLNGSFEMAANSKGEYCGWWEDGSRDLEMAEAAPRQIWSWVARTELKPSVIGADLRASMGFIEKPPEFLQALPPSIGLEDSLSCFEAPDEIQSPSNRVGHPQSKIDCLLMVAQILLELWGPATIRMLLSLVFNFVYSCFHLYFFAYNIVYSCVEKRRTLVYIVGISSCFLGYVAFALIYGRALIAGAEHAHQYSPIVYQEGAGAFLLGSMLLTCARRRVKSLFCGSLCFFFGSLVLSIDAMIHYPCLISVGYTMFAFGHVFLGILAKGGVRS